VLLIVPQAGARTLTWIPQGLSDNPDRADGNGCILRGGIGYRMHPTVQVTPRSSGLLHQEEGWKAPLCQDYRALNAITRKNQYLLPLINNLIHRLKDARYFTKLDIRWGYNNVCIREGDEWKATFHTNRGLFEPLVMCFGLTNSPATFQMMMNEIFQDLITKGVIYVYLDDILIFTNSLEDHRRITGLVLDRMREHKLYLRPEKCKFEKTKIEYLGVIISHNKVEMDLVKIAGVTDWPTPSNKKEVQSFVSEFLPTLYPWVLPPCAHPL
jgi:hypothetical protein